MFSGPLTLDPSRRRTIIFCDALWVLSLLTVAGCGTSGPQGPPRVTTVQVTGQINVDGQPEQGIAVRATPISGKTPTNSTPNARTDTDGVFMLATYEAGDGVPVGDYKLTFQWGQISLLTGRYSGDKFNGKYVDAENSAYSVSVSENDEIVNLGTIDLTTDDLPEPRKKAAKLSTGGDDQ